MPVCDVCQNFYVRSQTFEQLLSFKRLCLMCETYGRYTLNHDVIPMSYNTLEVYSFDAYEHPALTKRFFEWLINRPQSSVLFYDHAFGEHLEALSICNALLKPFRLFNYQKIPTKFLVALEEKVAFMSEK